MQSLCVLLGIAHTGCREADTILSIYEDSQRGIEVQITRIEACAGKPTSIEIVDNDTERRVYQDVKLGNALVVFVDKATQTTTGMTIVSGYE
jgi:hypothetical protein